MNFGTPVPLLIGLVLIVGAVALFFIDKLKPGYGRDSDKVYALLWMFSGILLVTHWDMNLPESLQQLIMAGMLIALTIENITSRGPKGDRYVSQAASDAPMPREPYRPRRTESYGRSSRMNVRAELENERFPSNRFPEDRRSLRGREEPDMRGVSYDRGEYPAPSYGDERTYGASTPPPSERSIGRLAPSGGDRIRRRRPKSVEGRYGDASTNGTWDEPPYTYGPDKGGYSSHSSSASSPYPQNEADSDSYVDYRPVDYPDNRPGRPSRDYGNGY